MYTCIHVYIHVSTNKIQQVAGESPFEPCSKCLVSWHQINKGMFICRCLSFAYAHRGSAYADILSYAEFPLAYAHQNLGLRHTLTRGPFPNMNARVWTWLICRKSKLSTKITCPCDCRDPPSIKQKVHLFHSMGDGSIPILGDFHVWSGWWLTYPSEKWWSSSVGMMTFPTYGKIKHVPNHQPVMDVFGMLKSHSIYLNIAYGSKMSMFLFATGPLCVVVGAPRSAQRLLPTGPPWSGQNDRIPRGSHV